MSKEEISKETKNTLQNCWVMTTNHELDNENRKLNLKFSLGYFCLK